jgi:hypothetical protein
MGRWQTGWFAVNRELVGTAGARRMVGDAQEGGVERKPW